MDGLQTIIERLLQVFLRRYAETEADAILDSSVAEKIRQSWEEKEMMRRWKFPRGALLVLGMSLPLHALAAEQHFKAIQVEKQQAFQQYEGFQLATLAQTPDVNIRINRLEDQIRRHTHPTSHHFLYVIKGQIELRVGDETKILTAEDFVTIPRGIPHSMHRIGVAEAVFLDVASPPDLGDVIWHE